MTEDVRKKLGAIDLSKRFAELIKFRVPTGIIAFDRVTGGGIPAGRLTEVYGDWSSGKTRLACHILAMTQKLDGVAMLLDVERALDAGLIALTGLDADKLIYPDPDKKLGSIEDVFDRIAEAIDLLRAEWKKSLLTIVWDSVASTPGLEDLDANLGRETGAARRAKVIGDGIKKIMSEVYRQKICLVFINQIRDKIGVMFGEKTDTVGGRMIKFTSSLRLHVLGTGKIKDEQTEEVVGQKGRLIVEKSRVCRPFGVVNYEMLVDQPLSPYTGLLDYMVRHGEVVEAAARGHFKFAGSEETFTKDSFGDAYERAYGGKEA